MRNDRPDHRQQIDETMASQNEGIETPRSAPAVSGRQDEGLRHSRQDRPRHCRPLLRLAEPGRPQPLSGLPPSDHNGCDQDQTSLCLTSCS